MPEPYYAAIPSSLAWADELLTVYGYWATRRNGGRTCGSAEGSYRAPTVQDDDARRSPKSVGMLPADAMAVQRSLKLVPDRERQVLAIMYVPTGRPIAARLRVADIRPRECRDLHTSGLRLFASAHNRQLTKPIVSGYRIAAS